MITHEWRKPKGLPIKDKKKKKKKNTLETGQFLAANLI